MTRWTGWSIWSALVIGMLLTTGCQQGRKPKAAAPPPEEGWNPRAAYKPPPDRQEPQRSGFRGDMDMVGNAGQAVRQGGERQKAKGILENIGLFLHQYHAEHGRTPANLEEFIAYIQRDAPHVVNALRDGYFVIVWKAPLNANTIVAYEKASYAGARAVLRGDKSIEVMRDAEFNQALQGKR